MKIEEMIEEINTTCQNSCYIIHYRVWELSSYQERNIFSSPKGTIKANSFKSLIEKAYKRIEEERSKINGKAKTRSK